MLKINLKRGDIITYTNGKMNNVNKPWKYDYYFNEHGYNSKLGIQIEKIERYKKILWFYVKKEVWKRAK